ncbi:MAG: YoaK family protein, partial [Frankiaceae bacterium]
EPTTPATPAGTDGEGPNGPGRPGKIWQLLSALSAVAGSLDALSYLAFGGVFTANMTGTVVLLAIAITGSGAEALRLVVALAGFVLGAIVGARPPRRLTRSAARAQPAWPGVTTASLAVELVVVLAWAIGWTLTGGGPGRTATYLLIAIAAVAMGLQSSAAGHVGIGGVSTAYVTGTLSALASQLTQRPARVREAVLRAGIVLAYLGGAAAGAGLRMVAPGVAGWLPPVGLAAAVLTCLLRDVSRPSPGVPRRTGRPGRHVPPGAKPASRDLGG